MNKHNPDIKNKLLDAIEKRNNQTLNNKFSNEYYKTITNQPIKEIKNVDDLKIDISSNNIDKQILSNKYESLEENRKLELLNIENEKKNNKIDEIDFRVVIVEKSKNISITNTYMNKFIDKVKDIDDLLNI